MVTTDLGMAYVSPIEARYVSPSGTGMRTHRQGKGVHTNMALTRLRKSIGTLGMATVVLVGTLAGSIALLSPSAQAAIPDGGTSSAYGINVQLLGGNLLGPIPSVTLGAHGATSGLSQTLPVDVPGLITANTLNAEASSTNYGTANESIMAEAGVEGLSGLNGISLLDTLLDVQAVNTNCDSTASGSTAATQIVGLSIGGAAPLNLPSPIPPNTGLTAAQLGPLAGLVTITLNKQSGQDRPAFAGTNINVTGIQITLLSVLDHGVVINVANSACSATGSDIEAPPSISGLSPAFGPAAGGTVVTITGAGFVPTSTVDFSNLAATHVTYVNPNEIIATSPVAANQTNNSLVPVTVTNQFGSGPLVPSAANEFLYEVNPTLTSITPTSGPTLGGQTVTLTGTNFGPDSFVVFGSGADAVPAPLTSTVVNAAGTQITAITPPHAAGLVDVSVFDVGGQSTLINAYRYIPAPIEVTSVVPDVGPTVGGTSVVITGQGFTGTTGATGVKFGANNATSYTVVNDTTIDAVSPAGAVGTVDVIVTNTSLNETPSSLDSNFAVVGDHFTYEAPPVISASGLNPNTGPVGGGTTVTITGTGFGSDSTVQFGANAGTGVVVAPSGTSLTVVSPASTLGTPDHSGPVNVTVTDIGGTSNSEVFTYVAAPIIAVNGITPDQGPAAGGTPVVITGSNFQTTGTTTVTFAGAQATGVTVVNGTTIDAVSPAGDPGPAGVVVTDIYGSSAPQNFTYFSPPVIGVNGLSPAFGPDTGGTTVTLTGIGLTGISAVNFGGTCAATGSTGGTPGTAVTPISDTTATVVTPAHADGATLVCVTAVGGTAPAAEEFTFEALPTISTNGINPAQGPVAGGTHVTITGSNFGPDSTVAFGANQATGVVVVNTTTITAVSPASTLPSGGAGAVMVTVTDGGGTSNGQSFTYVATPTISVSGVVPDSGPAGGGTNVTITGTGFTTLGTTTVSFGTAAATNVVVTGPTTITATSPISPLPNGGVGAVNVTVTDVGGTSNGVAYNYLAGPVVGASGLNPAYGPDTGGTTVTITGTGLTGIDAAGAGVNFGGTCSASNGSSGGTPGTSVTSISDTKATVVTPAHADGLTLVCVTAAGGTTEALEGFTFEPVPSATDLSPTQGPTSGGTPVTITGVGFGPGDPATTVSFGGNAATNVVVDSSTTITALSPASTLPGNGAGPVNVTVSDSGGGPAIDAKQFTYVVAPVISGISPTSGPESGGEAVNIKGTDLGTASSVLFGTKSATIVSVTADPSVVDGWTIVVTEPAGTGTVPVFVTTNGGTARAPENFTYIAPGYWEAASDGGVFAFGGARFLGSVPGVLKPGQVLNSPIVAMADTADHGGYWLFAADGGVFCFGDAPFYGSTYNQLQPGQKLNGPIVTAEATPDGGGYRMFAADGGVFDFGDAVFEGSLPGEKILPNAPIAGATAYPFGQGANPNNAGYWLVGADGSIFTFGNAPNKGNAVGQIFGKVVALATTPTGNGYYMFLQSGPVAAFGDAVKGLGGANSATPIVFGQTTSTGNGYWEFAADGGVYNFGDAPNEGSLVGVHLNAPITAGIAFGSS
jgi:hypothetical protein